MSYADIPGWCDFYDQYMEAVETAPRNATLVEVGTACGKSIAYLARTAISRGRNDLRLVAIDPWWSCKPWKPDPSPIDDCDEMGFKGKHRALWHEFGDTFGVFCGLMLRHAREEFDRITVLRLTSLEAVKLFDDASCWMVFIDANHEYEGISADIKAWRSKAMPGGIFAGHDHDRLHYKGVVRACEEELGVEGVGYRVQGTSWRMM